MLRYLILTVLWLAAAAADAAQPTLLIVGDSLSAGYGVAKEASWVTLLEKRLAGKGYGYRIVNASISGDTTQGGVARLPHALEAQAPVLVLIELGGNDGLRGFPLELIRHNLEAMIEMSQASGARVVLAGMQLPPNYGPQYTRGFRDIYPDLAQAHDVALVPFLLTGVALEPRLMQADGIHPNEAAQEKLLDNVWPVLEPELAGLAGAQRAVAGRRVAML